MADSTISFGLYGCESTHEEFSRPDAALLDGLRRGIDSSYEELIRHFQQPVYNIVYRLVSDHGDTNDVVQEVFLKVFRGVGKFRGESSLKTWIYRIAVNEAYNHRRWFGRWRGHEIGLDDDQGDGKTFEEVLSDTGKSPFDLALNQEAGEEIEAALLEIPPTFREALVLREQQELTYEEIAEILAINIGTVKSRIVRARRALREKLRERLGSDSPIPVSAQQVEVL